MSVEPKQIILETDSKMKVIWEDGLETEFEAVRLRRACPCAGCVNEWTGEKMLKDEEISESVEIEDVSLVGRYGLNLRFSDGHETGIYSFEYLKRLASED